MRNFKLIICGKDKRKNITCDEYDNLTDNERSEYIKPTRDSSGYRMKLIEDIMKMFDFETEDGLIDIGFIYNLNDKELLTLHTMLYGKEV